MEFQNTFKVFKKQTYLVIYLTPAKDELSYYTIK